MQRVDNIFSFITQEETAFANPVNVIDNYEWNLRDHIKTTVLYKNSQLLTGKTDDKPVKNIIRPILNLQYRSEGFDVKDITIFVNDSQYFYKSFLIKKFHDKWARENDLDTFIDELVESYVDFGGVLVKNINKVRPEVVPWQTIAFCDQTDILSGPIAIKHYFSADQLLGTSDMGWGEKKNGATATLEDLIVLSEDRKIPDRTAGKENNTPSKYIEVYEVHGSFPETFLDDEGNPDKYSGQLHIVSFYKDESGSKQGLTLFKGKEKEFPFKFLARDKIFGRAVGFGGAEELFEAQVWVTYDMIRMKQLLDTASKVIYKTTDAAFAARNKTMDLDNGEVLVLEDGKDINQIDTTPRNISLFDRSVSEWEAHAQQMGAANDALMGRSPSAGTPFKLQELITAEGHSLHEYRKGKIATFLSEIYRDWIIPYIAREVSKGQEFLASLDLDELQAVTESLLVCEANKFIKEKILNGELIDDTELLTYKENVKQQFLSGGNKKFIKILEGELKGTNLDVEINIAGKQKDLSSRVDKLVNIFRQLIANPAVLDDPRLAKIFNDILEASGLSPVNFGSISYKPTSQPVAQTGRAVLEAPEVKDSPIPVAT